MFQTITAALLFLLVIASMAWLLRLAYQAFARRGTNHNRKTQLHDVVVKLERVTGELNRLAQQVYGLQRQVDLLNYYEATLKVHEQLLLVMNQLVESEVSQMSLDSADFLAADLDLRVTRLSAGFATAMNSGKVDLNKLHGRAKVKTKRKACYFCSRPISNATQSKTSVKDGAETRRVLTCPVCLITIKETGTAQVLQFEHNGRQIHWSEYKDFLPNQEYWNINRPSGSKEKPRLTLVDSAVSSNNEGTTSDRDIDPSLH